ncbi:MULTISPECIES: hypothetical protein [Thalassospira]|uniref:hypothetical protein n=1 Tax=Thalassospira TaxID=168934 RepID=UPI002942C41E|nr:hypothetical protein [Thalassospira lucentensis]WOI10795.1 hypothetical protein R1T41_20080 [Thalassospira lucentensis]
MKYATLRKYVRFSTLKRSKCVLITLFFWPIIAGFLIYNQLLPNLDWLNFGIPSVFPVLVPLSPNRRKGLRAIAFKPTVWGWRRRPHPKLHLVVMHFAGPGLIFAYFGLSQHDAQFILPAFAFLGVLAIAPPLLFWRPLILRVLLGFDKRTKVFGVIK